MGDYDDITTALGTINTTLSSKLDTLNTNVANLNTKIDVLLTPIGTDIATLSNTLTALKNFILSELAHFDSNTGYLTRLENIKQHLNDLSQKLAALEPAFGKIGPQNIAQNIQDLRDVMEESFEDTKRLMKKAGLK